MSYHRQRYFDKTIHIQKIKDCISGKNEIKVIKILENLDYKINQDFVRQHPIGSKFVLDFAFIKEQVAIEIDGKNHKCKKQKNKDKKRDKFLKENNWIPIRINDNEFFGEKGMFYKYLIKEIVEERRNQYKNGFLYSIEIPDYIDKNYE